MKKVSHKTHLFFCAFVVNTHKQQSWGLLHAPAWIHDENDLYSRLFCLCYDDGKFARFLLFDLYKPHVHTNGSAKFKCIQAHEFCIYLVQCIPVFGAMQDDLKVALW